MKLFGIVAVLALALGIGSALFTTSSVSATVHPIQSGECSGATGGEPAGGEPPGISDDTKASYRAPLDNNPAFPGPAGNGDNGDEVCPAENGGDANPPT